MKLISALLSFQVFFAYPLVQAQFLPNECATLSSATDKLKKIPGETYRVLSGTRVLKMHVVIYRDNDGSNQAMPEEDVKNEIRFANSIYSIGNICFSIVGIEFRNSTFYNNPVVYTDYQNQYVSGTFTVFVVNSISDENGDNEYYGWSPGIITNRMITRGAGFGPRRTFVHEMGHALGLEHTFKGTGHDPYNSGCDELVNGTNGETCGDFVKDTPADPYLRCGDNISGCTFPYTSATCKDANNQGYAPQMNNFMSYWANKGCNRTVFTTGQYNRMIFAIDNNTVLSSLLAPDYVSLSNATISSGWVREAAKYQLSAGNLSGTSGYVVNGNTQAALSSGVVYLKPGFTAAPNATGVVRILASTCQ